MKGYIDTVDNIYRATYSVNQKITIKNTNEFTTLLPIYSRMTYGETTITITAPNGSKTIINYSGSQSGDIVYTFLFSGIYLINYKGETTGTDGTNQSHFSSYSFTYSIGVVENKLPLKPWTITSVINRLLDLCEPIRKGEKPRFRLNGMDADGNIIPEGQTGSGQAAKFDKIQSPQFALTRQTLRECLQEIGKVIHGEPRLRIKRYEHTYIKNESFENGVVNLGSSSAPYEEDKPYYVQIDGEFYPLALDFGADPTSPSDDIYTLTSTENEVTGSYAVFYFPGGERKYYYEVYYDMYASQEKSNIYTLPYVSKGAEWAINNYEAWIDSHAENLINQLDKLGGVIVEPFEGGAKSVRTESQYVRITDGNMLIATQYPIYTIDKLEYVFMQNGRTQVLDITSYVFEKSEYDTRLSSYQEQYPYSKAYALYFSQGSKNIGGLNFKVEAASSLIFKNYAITNILKQLLGDDYQLPDYPLIAFRVTYTPIYSARIAQTKTNYKDFKYPAALIVNQESNIIESRYYGENLKGIAARLGNVEKSLLYCLGSLKIVPRAGQLFRKDYYISAVATEILPNYIRCTVGLSKDFNRISGYIGVPSEKRYYEVSKQQAMDRNVLYREYIVIGDNEPADDDTLMNSRMLEAIAETFTGEDSVNVTHVKAWGATYKGNDLPTVDLPVISSAFGNSISFSWKYEDNYSAGAISQKIENSAVANDKEITGYWQNDARYADYYGRIYYYNFSIASGGGEYNQSTSLSLPQSGANTISAVVTTVGKKPYILRKDSREALQFNYQIDFVTNTDIIIGTALASNCPAVRLGGTGGKARLYVLPTDLNKFTDHVEGWEEVKLSDMPYVEVDTQVSANYFTISAAQFPAAGSSWVIVTPQSKLPAEQVEDESGNPYEYQETIGGDLLIGRNIEVTAGQAFTPIYFTKKREIFDKSVWKDIK